MTGALIAGSRGANAALKGGPVWLVTFATYHRRQVFANPDIRTTCAAALRETSQRNGYRVHALAIMPDHVHVVVGAGATGHPASKVANNLKGVTSRRVFQTTPELKMDLQSEHLWADEYQARPLSTASALLAACRYVERNPPAAGLPQQLYSWVEATRPGPALQGGGSSHRADHSTLSTSSDARPALQGGGVRPPLEER